MILLWILEDEKSPIASFRKISHDEFQVEYFHSIDVLQKALKDVADQPDFLITNVYLPDGMFDEAWMGECTERGIPFFVISDTDDFNTFTSAFKAGATDVFVKPVNRNELVFKIKKTLGQKSSPRTLTLPEFPELILDTDTQRIIRSDLSKGIPLTPTEYRIVYLFFTKTSELLDRNKIISDVWAQLLLSSKVFDFHLSKLREKLRRLSINIQFVGERNYSLRVE